MPKVYVQDVWTLIPLALALRDPRRTRWEISRELRESWPAVSRPEETACLGSSSSPEVVSEDQPMLANTAKVG
jgi:hypothetical protein